MQVLPTQDGRKLGSRKTRGWRLKKFQAKNQRDQYLEKKKKHSTKQHPLEGFLYFSNKSLHINVNLFLFM